MSWLDPVATVARRAASGLRHHSRRVARVATRFNRAGLYAWDVVVWSRVEAGRTGLLSLDLPDALLGKKEVRTGPPLLRVRSPAGEHDHFNDGFAAVNVILFGNLQMPDLLCPCRYALPGPAFRGVYLWDSAFIAQIWRWWDRAVAVDVLRAVVALREGDRLQHVVADFVQSDFTQPPLLAWSLVTLLEDHDAAAARVLAEEFFPPLAAYHAWLRLHRRLPSGLYAWQHPYESGLDNSPRFASCSERRMDATAQLAAPDFSTYVVLQAEALAALAQRLGHDEAARAYTAEAEDLRACLNRELWHEQAGLYFDRDARSGAWREVRSVASLLPLWAGVPDAVQAVRLREVLMDPRAFGSLLPVPSVALDDPSFEADMWRGPVWVNLAYGVILGLRRAGHAAEAAELAWRLCDGVYRVFRDERQIYEFYDPRACHTRELRRKRGNWWKRFTLGSGPQREFVGWSGLVNNLVIEVLFGLARGEEGRVLRPAFPEAAVGAVFRLVLPGDGLTVEVAVEARTCLRGFVQNHEGLRTFEAGVGESVALDALLRQPAGAAPVATGGA